VGARHAETSKFLQILVVKHEGRETHWNP